MSSTVKKSAHDAKRIRLIWIDPSDKNMNTDYQHTLKELNTVMNDVVLLKTIPDSVRLLNDPKLEKAFIITSGAFGKDLLPKVHGMKQVGLIYIFCRNHTQYVPWASQWSKIRGVYSHIQPICKSLKRMIGLSDDDIIPISFMQAEEESQSAETSNLNRLEPSFMYTQVFKKILSEMTFDTQARHMLIEMCQKAYADNPDELETIEEFAKEYHSNKVIWWYTRECFIYKTLNRALRNLETDIIVDMGLIIHDLHQQLERLHSEQYQEYTDRYLRLYRGQALSNADFDKLQKTQGGLISFNSFLSTSQKREVSLEFSKMATTKESMIGILFVIEIDLKTNRTPFANVNEFGYFNQEAEVLFSMHSVFRIGEICSLDKTNKLFQVVLTSTTRDDRELRKLTDQIEKEVIGGTGWHGLIKLLIKLGRLEKAEILSRNLLSQKLTQQDESHYKYELGRIKHDQGDFEAAINFYEAALLIDPDLSAAYQGLGQVYDKRGDLSKALTFYDKALYINQQTLPIDHPALAACYNNIAGVYKSREEYSKALIHYEKANDIWQINLPPNHPDFAILYNNIGTVHFYLEDNFKALNFFKKARDIWEKTLPANHPDLAMSYNNIGMVYDQNEEYQKALSFYNKALAIRQNNGTNHHPSLGTTYNNIGMIYMKSRKYMEALSFYKQALDIWEQTLPENHPNLAIACNNIGSAHRYLENRTDALSFYQRALDIRQQNFGPHHSSVLDIRQSINLMNRNS